MKNSLKKLQGASPLAIKIALGDNPTKAAGKY